MYITLFDAKHRREGIVTAKPLTAEISMFSGPAKLRSNCERERSPRLGAAVLGAAVLASVPGPTPASLCVAITATPASK